MSVSRETMSEILDIPADRIRCDRCVCADRWINDALICKGWGNQVTYADRYCSLFAEREATENDST